MTNVGIAPLQTSYNLQRDMAPQHQAIIEFYSNSKLCPFNHLIHKTVLFMALNKRIWAQAMPCPAGKYVILPESGFFRIKEANFLLNKVESAILWIIENIFPRIIFQSFRRTQEILWKSFRTDSLAPEGGEAYNLVFRRMI